MRATGMNGPARVELLTRTVAMSTSDDFAVTVTCLPRASPKTRSSVEVSAT